jgi:acetolactate synthase-1/2/3 large subunit
MTGAEAIASILKREGVECVFCFPDNLLIEEAARLDIRPVMARTERTSVAMADGYTRVLNGRQPGVVVVQYGPGIENSFGGVAQAFSDSSPLLIFSGHISERRLGQEPTFDAVANFRGITKWAARINVADRIPELLRRAFTYLRTGRPGPVLLDVPMEVARGQVDPDEIAAYRCVSGARSAADPEAVKAAVAALLRSERPLVHAGQGVLYADACPELIEFAELVGAPVMTTLPGKSAFPEDHPLAVGAGGKSGPKTVAKILESADFVFALGASLTTSIFAAPIPPGKQIAQVTVDERDMNKDYSVEHLLMGDAKLVLGQLIDEARRQGASGTREETLSELRSMRAEVTDDWMPLFTSDDVPMSPYRVIWDLMQSVNVAETIITHDSGLPRDQLSPFWVSKSPRGYLGWGKSTHLGYGMGLAMGAKLAAPEKLVVNVMGDSAIGMVGMEVETAFRERIPILTIVLNNGGMSFYEKSYPAATEKYGLKYMTGDYASMASALGAFAMRVDSPARIGEALTDSFDELARGRPALLEMMTREEPASSKYW